jgi:hypothetical protein
MSHTYHEGLRGYDERQILHDGCPECEYRAENAERAIANMDNGTFARAWKRAFDWQASRGGGYEATGDLSHAELLVLRTLWAIQVQLERAGRPLDGRVPA